MSSNEVATVTATPSWVMSFDQMERLAERIAKSGLFGLRTADQALSLMAIAQAEGKHPALAARDYDIIQGRPAKRAEAMMRDFFMGGGTVKWHELTDEAVDATFSHPIGGEARIRWDSGRVKRAGLSGREGHAKYPRQMLRSRVVSEGVRTIWPVATGGLYVPEEIADMPRREPIDVTPPATPIDTAADLDAFAAEPPVDQAEIDGVLAEADAKAALGTEAFRGFWALLNHRGRELLRPNLSTYQAVAATVDATRLVDEERARDDDPFGLPPISEEHFTHVDTTKHALILEHPAVPFAAAVRALVPVVRDDGELNWPAWSEAFVALIQHASRQDCEKLRISSLPQYNTCRTFYGDGARAIVEALAAKTKTNA